MYLHIIFAIILFIFLKLSFTSNLLLLIFLPYHFVENASNGNYHTINLAINYNNPLLAIILPLTHVKSRKFRPKHTQPNLQFHDLRW